jgi:hypothetical protein
MRQVWQAYEVVLHRTFPTRFRFAHFRVYEVRNDEMLRGRNLTAEFWRTVLVDAPKWHLTAHLAPDPAFRRELRSTASDGLLFFRCN